MINAVFFRSGGKLTGFILKGHSDTAEAGRDICCAAVSSAAQLTCNAVTDFLKCAASVKVRENFLELALDEISASGCAMISAFYTHLRIIAEDFPQGIGITVKEKE